MLKAIVLDESTPTLSIIREFCKKNGFVQLQKTFAKPNDALNYLNKFPVDLLFLAVQLPIQSGIKFSKIIGQNTQIIFMSAYSKYAVEAFNIGAADFLLKPFKFERFCAAVKKAEEHFKFLQHKENSKTQYLFVRADYNLLKIALTDILYIEGLDDYLKIHIRNQKMVVAKMTLKSLQEKLPANEFIRVHRSFIVPVGKITSIHKKIISVEEVNIPIGTSYAQKFLQLFKP